MLLLLECGDGLPERPATMYPCHIETTMGQFENHFPEYALDLDPANYYWSNRSPQAGDHFTITFPTPLRPTSDMRSSTTGDDDRELPMETLFDTPMEQPHPHPQHAHETAADPDPDDWVMVVDQEVDQEVNRSHQHQHHSQSQSQAQSHTQSHQHHGFRIRIETGKPHGPCHDRLVDGVVEIRTSRAPGEVQQGEGQLGEEQDKDNNHDDGPPWITVGHINGGGGGGGGGGGDGSADVTVAARQICALRIRVTRGQHEWLAIRTIDVALV